MSNGRTRLHVVANGTMTGQRYIDEVLLPHVRLFRGAVGDKFVFMDDNTTCHRTLAVQDCLDSEGIQRLVWAARSPDLNPVENVWDALGRQVAGRNYPPTNKNTLICALTEEWDKLPQQLLDNVEQTQRPIDGSRAGFQAWPFMTVHTWGENPDGVWKLEVHNEGRFYGRATLKEWYLHLYGTTEDPDVPPPSTAPPPTTTIPTTISTTIQEMPTSKPKPTTSKPRNTKLKAPLWLKPTAQYYPLTTAKPQVYPLEEDLSRTESSNELLQSNHKQDTGPWLGFSVGSQGMKGNFSRSSSQQSGTKSSGHRRSFAEPQILLCTLLFLFLAKALLFKSPSRHCSCITQDCMPS
ncbi:hypothetical protein TNCV_1103742 [Trichonephila clavipes]|nr:hypothetical protein TNCV_1103742 [Trichonephila clavipes]